MTQYKKVVIELCRLLDVTLTKENIAKRYHPFSLALFHSYQELKHIVTTMPDVVPEMIAIINSQGYILDLVDWSVIKCDTNCAMSLKTGNTFHRDTLVPLGIARGRVIILEGGDGVGKTTTAMHLQNILKMDYDITANLMRDPGSTPSGELLRQILKGELNNDEKIHNYTELLLFIAAKVQLITEAIQKNLELGHWVILDRFYLSTIGYQGHALGMLTETIDLIKHFILPLLQPELLDFTVLDIPEDEKKRRRDVRGYSDRMEQKMEKGNRLVAIDLFFKSFGVKGNKTIANLFPQHPSHPEVKYFNIQGYEPEEVARHILSRIN